MRSQAELLDVSGYQDRPSDFNDLLRILDGELRLITPTDPEGESLSNSARHSSLSTRYYQLTHDYLVPSLREWLTRKQRETRKGRAELRLTERAAIWSEKRENNLGPSVPFNLEKLKTLPKELVLPELQTRFASATNPRHKLSLAFALANYGHLDADYLVSRVDDIAESDTRNYVTALQANASIAIASIQAKSAKCADKSLWRRKAKLAKAALNLGETSLALDMCTFEDRPDPEQRTIFIDDFPRWENHLEEVHDAVASSKSPALRSGICLGVGQIAVEKLAETDRERWQTLASRWFVEKADTSTHSAAGWLLRRWGFPEPKAPERDKIVSHRDWFVNSVGATMLKIRSNTTAAVNLMDPLEIFRKQLAWISQLAQLPQQLGLQVEKDRVCAFFFSLHFACANSTW